MDKRLYPITIVTVALFAVAAFGYLAPGAPAGTPVRVLLDNKAGKVVFEHKSHAEDYGLDCETCHHQGSLVSDTEIVPCAECHNADTAGEGMPGRMEAFHQQCMGCHEEMSGPYGPDQCNQCHLK